MRKSRSSGISSIFLQCCFLMETQVLMTVSDFSSFSLGIISWKGASLFSWRGGGHVKWGEGAAPTILKEGGFFEKNHKMGGTPGHYSRQYSISIIFANVRNFGFLFSGDIIEMATILMFSFIYLLGRERVLKTSKRSKISHYKHSLVK